MEKEHTKLCRLSGVCWNERCCYVQVMWYQVSSGCWRCVWYRRKCVWRCRRDEGIYILEFLRFLGLPCEISQFWFLSCVVWVNNSKNGPACILHNHQAPQEWESSSQDLGLAVRRVYDAGRCLCIAHHIYGSDLVHLGADWVVLRLSQLCKHSTWLPRRLAVQKAQQLLS